VNEATAAALLESRALRGRLAIVLRNSEAGLTGGKRPSSDDLELIEAEMALVRQC
jgi:hypothetical protein